MDARTRAMRPRHRRARRTRDRNDKKSIDDASPPSIERIATTTSRIDRSIDARAMRGCDGTTSIVYAYRQMIHTYTIIKPSTMEIIHTDEDHPRARAPSTSHDDARARTTTRRSSVVDATLGRWTLERTRHVLSPRVVVGDDDDAR